MSLTCSANQPATTIRTSLPYRVVQLTHAPVAINASAHSSVCYAFSNWKQFSLNIWLWQTHKSPSIGILWCLQQPWPPPPHPLCTKRVIWCTFIHMAVLTSSMTNAAQTLCKQLYLDPKIPRCCYANYIQSHNDPSRIRTCVATDIPSPGEQPNTSPFIVPSQWLTILQETVPIVQWMVPPS